MLGGVQDVHAPPMPMPVEKAFRANFDPDPKYLTLNGDTMSVVRKRGNSKSYHDELKRSLSIGFPRKLSKKARSVSLVAIGRWEKLVVP